MPRNDESDEEQVHIETPLDTSSAPPVLPDNESHGENFGEHVPEKIEIDPNKKRVFMVSFKKFQNFT